MCKYLLERGARVDGGASETVATETPLQVSAASGDIKLVELFMSYGASPFTAAARQEAAPIATSGSLSAISRKYAYNPAKDADLPTQFSFIRGN